MTKKAVISTLLVIQLSFLLFLTASVVVSESEIFTNENSAKRFAAYQISYLFDDIQTTMQFLDDKEATNETIDEYIAIITNTTEDYFPLDININSTNLMISDSKLEMIKEGEI